MLALTLFLFFPDSFFFVALNRPSPAVVAFTLARSGSTDSQDAAEACLIPGLARSWAQPKAVLVWLRSPNLVEALRKLASLLAGLVSLGPAGVSGRGGRTRGAGALPLWRRNLYRIPPREELAGNFPCSRRGC